VAFLLLHTLTEVLAMARFLTQVVLGLGSGLVGALALTAAHEGLRRNAPVSPRMDVLGMRALKGLASALGFDPPRGKKLRRDALVGDLVANTAFFSLAARGRHPVFRGVTLGLLAGMGATLLPPVLGLGRTPRSKTIKAETVGLYVIGGLAAAGVAWLAMSARDRSALERAKRAAEEARLGVNQRNSGMIH
jgi:hypothetical protein